MVFGRLKLIDENPLLIKKLFSRANMTTPNLSTSTSEISSETTSTPSEITKTHLKDQHNKHIDLTATSDMNTDTDSDYLCILGFAVDKNEYQQYLDEKAAYKIAAVTNPMLGSLRDDNSQKIDCYICGKECIHER